MLVRHTDGLVSFEVADDSPLALDIQRRDLEAQFARGAGSYPQYAGWAAAAQLVRVARTVRTKGGLAFEPGDLALAQWDDDPRLAEVGLAPHWCVYSTRRGWHVALPAAKVEVLA